MTKKDNDWFELKVKSGHKTLDKLQGDWEDIIKIMDKKFGRQKK